MTTFVICNLVKNAPQFILTSPENLSLLINQAITHIQHDHQQVKILFALAWQHAFEAAAYNGKANILNEHFVPIMQNLHEVLSKAELILDG